VRDAHLAKAASRVGGEVGAAATLALTAAAAAGGGGQMSDVNRQYALAQAERELAAGGGGAPHASAGVAAVLPEAHAALMRVARKEPYYERNEARLCSFFAKGECTRGALCPYRHEMPRDKSDPLAKQNLLDRYHGTNDPLAAKLLGRMEARSSAPPPPPPADATLTSLWVSGIDARVGEADLRAAVAPYGDARTVRLAPAKGCAFVEMASRAAAEAAVAALHSSLSIGGLPLRVAWAKPKAREGGGEGGGSGGGGSGSRSGGGGGGGGGGAAAPPPPQQQMAAPPPPWPSAAAAAPPPQPPPQPVGGVAPWAFAAAAAAAAFEGGGGGEGAAPAVPPPRGERPPFRRTVGAGSSAPPFYPSQDGGARGSRA
jgi:pre-mRNA-splicing factor RBM22/SLT11